MEVISADSHVVEPPELWGRIEARYEDRVPRLISTETGDAVAFPSGRVASYAGFATAGHWQDPGVTRQATLRPALFDPLARLAEADADGIAREVLFPSFAMHLYEEADPALQSACMRVYNDWILEYCAAAPDRLFPVAILPTDTHAALTELKRLEGLAYHGVLVNAHPHRERDFGTDQYEEVWERLSDAHLPACLHLYAGDSRVADEHFLATYTVDPALVQHSLALLVFSGALSRHPTLRVVSVESDVGWVAHFLHRMDQAWKRKRQRWNTALPDDADPGALFRRQVACTFTEDRAAMRSLPETGADIYLWGSDYPHNDSSWPDSREVLARSLAGVSEADRAKMLHDNACRVFNLPA